MLNPIHCKNTKVQKCSFLDNDVNAFWRILIILWMKIRQKEGIKSINCPENVTL